MFTPIIIGIILLIAAILFIYKAKNIHREIKKLKIKHKIQDGEITYQDLNKPAKTLFSKKYRISGKPDYIVQNNNLYIPVEFKTGHYDKPKKYHVFQLAAYCQLVEDQYNSFVPYGILVYNDSSEQFKIPFDPKIRFELENSIKKMRQLVKRKQAIRNHNDKQKCRSCSMKQYCKLKIV